MTEPVVFATFTRGEYGDLGPRLGQDEGEGWFHGRNVVRYRNGTVGPRAGLRKFVRDAGDAWPDGLVRAMWPSDQLGVLWGSHLRKLEFANMEMSVKKDYEADGDIIPGGNEWPVAGANRFGNDWVLVPGVGLYRANKFDIPEVGIITVDPPEPPAGFAPEDQWGRSLAFYRERLYVGQGVGDDGSLARVAFSDPGNEGYYNLDYYFDLTSGGPPMAMAELRDSLVLLRHSGMDLLTGSAGTSSGTMRKLTNHAGVDAPTHVAALETDVLVMMARGRPYPSLYNGALWEELTHLRFAGGAREAGELPGYAVTGLAGSGDWLIVADNDEAILELDSTRTKHEFSGMGLGPFAVHTGGRVVVLSDGGALDAPPEFFALDLSLDRPAFTSDAAALPGDDSTFALNAYLHLPEWWDPIGDERLVKAVVVDLIKFDTGSPVPNRVEVTVEAHNRYTGIGPVSSETQTWEEPGNQANEAGVHARLHLPFGDQGWGGGFRLKLDHLRGVAIKSVTALTQRRATRSS